ncbi:MAG: tripartite tricarboxylate transporter substrate binding protein [Rhizobiales bacterium]|nr:tripartite tricarboxylate transporter substrate binding protein [Hyphomicrobiales bacterium]
MAISRRTFTRGVAMALAVSVGGQVRAQQSRPIKPVKMITPYGAGGGADAVIRVIGADLERQLGQPFLVENRPGAGTLIAAQAVANAEPDGHTFLMTGHNTHTVNPFIYAKLPYDPAKDFTPITIVSFASILFAVSSSIGVKTVPEFINWVRSQKRDVTFGTWGVGGSPHLYGVLLAKQYGLPLIPVAFRGEHETIPEVLAGRVDATFGSPMAIEPHVQSGALTALGMLGAQRFETMPDLPTFTEQGLVGYDLNGFIACWTTAKVPTPLLETYVDAFAVAGRQPGLLRRLVEVGQVPVFSGPAELKKRVQEDAPRWKQLVENAGIKPS